MAETKKTTKKEEKVVLNPLVWEVPYNADLVSQVLFVYSSNERKGSARQKSRGDVSGGGKKPWKQKGTGRARHGSTRSPIWVGGGVTFANKGRNFKKKINSKMAKRATCVMLSERLRKEELSFSKLTNTQAKNLRKDGEKRMLVISDKAELGLTLRNIKSINFVEPNKLNAKHLVSAKKIVVDSENVKNLEDRLINEK